ncbi:MAG: ribonuclease E/G, partial [Lachnospiraceae bacterium]|nr:ribonuclease E/G [Lachnospiraceae bacterium]
SMPLSILYGLAGKYSESVSTKVNLRSGGFIVIEPTEAMTVIDVNSGKSDNKKTKEQLVRQTNLEAAREIFRQIRLRNLSGIIIVDFINSESEACEEELKSLMKELALKDPVKTAFVDITKLGLAEITRQKKYVSFKEIG